MFAQFINILVLIGFFYAVVAFLVGSTEGRSVGYDGVRWPVTLYRFIRDRYHQK